MNAHRRQLNITINVMMDAKLVDDAEACAALASISRSEYIRRVLRAATKRHRTLRPAGVRDALERMRGVAP